MKNVFIILIIFFWIGSCDPCDDCDAISFEPTVSFVFINQDSIAELEALSTINSLDIETINSTIAALDPSEVEKIDSLNEVKSKLDSINAVYSSTQSTMNSGLLKVDQVAFLGANSSLTFEDSATAWTIPLSYNGAFTQYEVTIAGVTETIELTYDNYQEVDQERNVLIRAENIRVVNTSYDSLINCEENCVDGETTLTFYF
ncbi:MAG: hypothetical protein ABJG47_15940 [Ekhidna sp.]